MRHYAYSPYIWPMLATAAFNAFVATYAWRRRSVPGALPFALSLVIEVLLAASAALVLAAVDASTKIFWTKFGILLLLPVATATLCFLLEYANLNRWLTRRTLILLGIPPLLFALLIITDQANHMVWVSFSVGRYVHPVRGWAGWLFTGYGYMVMLANSIVVIWLFVRSPLHRVPAAVCLIGQLAPRATFLLEANGINPFAPMDFTVIALTFTNAMYALALFRLRMLDLIPVARGTMIEQMREGVLVLDMQQHIVDLNPAAERILGLPAAPCARGSDALQILPEFSALLAHLPDPGMKQTEISRGTGKEVRHYTLHVSSLRHRRGVQLGSLILLQDITEQEEAKERLLQQQRALAALHERDRIARELHDSLGQVLGYVKMQGQAARDSLARRQAKEADRFLEHLVSAAEETHADVREYILGATIGTQAETSFLASLRQYLSSFSTNYQIPTDLYVPPEMSDGVLAPTVEVQLLRIIQEALTNTRKHARARQVRVSFRLGDSEAEVLVEDDGAGFDVAPPAETSQFGLRFMRERAEEVGGCVSVNSTPGQGTQVVVRIPMKKNHENAGAYL